MLTDGLVYTICKSLSMEILKRTSHRNLLEGTMFQTLKVIYYIPFLILEIPGAIFHF